MSIEQLVLQLKQEIVDEVLRRLNPNQMGERLNGVVKAVGDIWETISKLEHKFDNIDVDNTHRDTSIANLFAFNCTNSTSLAETDEAVKIIERKTQAAFNDRDVQIEALRDRVNHMASMQEQIAHQREQIQLLLSHVGYLTNRLSRVVVLDVEANQRGEQPPVSFEFTEGAVDKLRGLVQSEVAAGMEHHLETQPHHTRTMEARDVRQEVVRALETAVSELRSLL